MKVAIFKPISEHKLQLSLHQEVLVNTEIYEENMYNHQSTHPNVQLFIHSKANYKIVIFYISNLMCSSLSEDEISMLFRVADKIILYEEECSIDIYDIVKQYDTFKFYFDVACFINEDTNATIVYDTYWFRSSSNFYINSMSWFLSSNYNPFSKKKYLFDMLYGTPKIHRTYIRELILRFPDEYKNLILNSKVLKPATNTNSMHNTVMKEHKDNIWEDEMNPINDTTDVYVEYYGDRKMHPSQVLPLKIYNESAYSIVMETYYDNQYTFITEKTIKPIVAKRLFMVVGGRHHLKNLRKLGFKTFNGIIDESYDNEPNYKIRCHLIIDQMINLCRQSQSEIYLKILPIVTYNFKHLQKLSTEQTPNYIHYVAELANKAFIEGQIENEIKEVI